MKQVNYQSVMGARELLAELEKRIHEYLVKLQDAEAAIISVDNDIACGHYNCHHHRPNPLFHHMQNHGPYVRAKLSYKIESQGEAGITIDLTNCHRTITVPYEFSQDEFEEHCNVLFEKEKADMEHCFKVKEKAIKQEAEDNVKDKRIRGKHVHDKYTYRWTDCDRCHGMGKVSVGTGEWKEDPFSYSDSPREIEITRQEPCPRCHGAMGLVIFSKRDGLGTEGEFPCNRWRFERNEDDFVCLLAEAQNRTESTT